MTHIDSAGSQPVAAIDLHTSAAMLISVFGQPERAEAQVNSFQWRLVLDNGVQVRIFSQQTGSVSAATVQPWRVEGGSPAAIDQVQQAMQAGADYYDGALHPELFITRKG